MDDEKQPLVYIVDGVPHTGTLKDYANAEMEAYYSGAEVDGVWVVEYGHMRYIKPLEQADSDDRYIIRELSLPNGEIARYRVEVNA